MNEIKGSIFKRKYLGGKMRYLKPGDPIEANYWVTYMVNGIRKQVCLDTAVESVAKERWRNMQESLGMPTNEERYLRKLIEDGQRASDRLHQIQHGGDIILTKDAFERFLASKRRRAGTKEATLKAYRQQFNRFAKWAPGTIKSMRDLSPALCEKYVSDLETSGMNADTVNKHIDCLGLIWKTVDPSWRNPWTGLHSTRQHTAEHYRRLSLTECKTLYKAAEGDLRVLILLGFSTGQRLGDLATLKWTQIDMKERIITLIPSKTDKRKAPEVQIPITDQLFKTLKALPKDVFVMPEVAILYKMNGPGLSKRIAGLMTDNGVLDDNTGRAAFHSFRGTFASMIGDSGANIQIEAYLTSHALPGVTGIYSHPSREVLRQWVKKAIPKL